MSKIYLKRITALLLSIITVFSVFSLTGSAFSTGAALPVTLDERSLEICDKIKENSYVDIEKIVTTLPDLSLPVKIVGRVFYIDTALFTDLMLRLRDECYAQDHVLLGKVFYFMGAYFKGFDNCEVYLEDEGNNIYKFYVRLTYSDGTFDILDSGAYYNADTGLFYGKDEKGIFDVGYNFDINEMVIYATVNGWMRKFGFCLGYDLISYALPLYFYHTRRFKFYYGGKEWMIQAWKGMYVAANGAEVGVYNRYPGYIGTYYNCVDDEDMLTMSFELYHDDELLFTRPEAKYWWINGFQLSKDLYSADELTLRFTIEMKDEAMLKAFVRAVKHEIHRDVT